MSSILMDGVTDVFKSQVLGSFAANSGESEASVVRGFQAGVGAMVAGLASKVGQSGFSRQVFDLINNPANDTKVLENARSLVGEQPKDGVSSRFMSMLFGGRLSAVTDMIGSASGVRGGTAASLMSLGAPLLLASLGKRVREGGLDNSRLSSFLAQEASDLRGTLPPGIGSLLNSETVSAVPPVASAVIRERSNSWIWLALAALAAVLGLVWWFRPQTPNVASIPNVVSNAATAVSDLVTRTLPGNVDLHIPVGRMEDHLLTWIQDPTKSVDQTTWFDFDRLLFATNSATLEPSSDEQLRNIASILTAYPNVHAKIGGYTDNTGDANANLTLSQQRADSVRQQLIGMGISADRLEAQGYGDQHPVADNASADGRQLNRRISLRVTQK
jgi:OmpA-OmpF porin, OOP family